MTPERVMEHAESVESRAVGRYLLGEMPDEERDAFEEHYFACVECGEEVHAGTAIVAGVRAMNRKSQWKPRTAWMSLAAAVGFAIFSGYQVELVVPRLTQQIARVQQERDDATKPRVLQPFHLSTGMQRGGTENQVIRGDRPFELEVAISPEVGATGYVLEIVDAGGVTRAKVHVTSDEATDSVHFQPPGSKLPPGRYSLKVSPEKAGRPSSVQFEVQ